MQAQSAVTFRGSYVVRDSDIDKLCCLLEARVGEVEMTIYCADGARRLFSSWTEIKSYENADRTQIVELSISSRSTDWEKLVRLDISRENDSTIRLHIECPNDEYLSLNSDITDLLEGMKQKVMSVFFDLNFFPYFMTFCASLGLFFAILGAFTYDSNTTGSIDLRALIIIPSIMLFASILLIICWIRILKLRPKIFPTVHFAIGQGHQRYENWKSRWNWSLIIFGIAVGVLSLLSVVLTL